MNSSADFLYHPRDHKTIELWKEVTDDQWNDPSWQKKNSIRSVDQLRRVIKLSKHQEEEIRRTIGTLRVEGKEPLRITPYYASLMQADPFNPVFFGEVSLKRIDPIFWQSVPTPANLMFPDAGVEGAMSEGSRSYGATVCTASAPSRLTPPPTLTAERWIRAYFISDTTGT